MVGFVGEFMEFLLVDGRRFFGVDGYKVCVARDDSWDEGLLG